MIHTTDHLIKAMTSGRPGLFTKVKGNKKIKAKLRAYKMVIETSKKESFIRFYNGDLEVVYFGPLHIRLGDSLILKDVEFLFDTEIR